MGAGATSRTTVLCGALTIRGSISALDTLASPTSVRRLTTRAPLAPTTSPGVAVAISIRPPAAKTIFRRLQLAAQMHSQCRTTCWKYNAAAAEKVCRFGFPVNLSWLKNENPEHETTATVVHDRDKRSRVRHSCLPPRNNERVNNTFK